MTALELFREGRLTEAVRDQGRLVASRPDDAAGRLLLTELLLYHGDLDAARNQLDAIPGQDPALFDYLDAYRLLIGAEAKRQRLPIDAPPQFLLEPAEHIAWRLEALDHLRAGRPKQAVHALDEADALLPWVVGHVDGREFSGARDGDDLFGPLLEVLVGGEYVWFPVEQIGRLRLTRDGTLRDDLFVPARLRAVSGEEWDVHLPALYPGSALNPDDEVRAGHATDWLADPGGPTRGVGLRIISFGGEELSLLDFTQWEA